MNNIYKDVKVMSIKDTKKVVSCKGCYACNFCKDVIKKNSVKTMVLVSKDWHIIGIAVAC